MSTYLCHKQYIYIVKYYLVFVCLLVCLFVLIEGNCDWALNGQPWNVGPKKTNPGLFHSFFFSSFFFFTQMSFKFYLAV